MKEWFIIIGENQEGPFSVADLRKDLRITPDTLVWKQGFDQWVQIRKVPELKTLFEDVDQDKKSMEPPPTILPEDDTLTLSSEPPYFYFWIIVTLISVTYAIYHLFTVPR